MIDISNGVQRADGKALRVHVYEVLADRDGSFIYGRYEQNPNCWLPGIWVADGEARGLGESTPDIIPIPRVEQRWVNHYVEGLGCVNRSRKEADDAAKGCKPRLAVLRYTLTPDGKPDTSVPPAWEGV